MKPEILSSMIMMLSMKLALFQMTRVVMTLEKLKELIF
jgi:hypothetical protein